MVDTDYKGRVCRHQKWHRLGEYLCYVVMYLLRTPNVQGFSFYDGQVLRLTGKYIMQKNTAVENGLSRKACAHATVVLSKSD